MASEEFFKALKEGEALAQNGGETYLKRESGRRYALKELGL